VSNHFSEHKITEVEKGKRKAKERQKKGKRKAKERGKYRKKEREREKESTESSKCIWRMGFLRQKFFFFIFQKYLIIYHNMHNKLDGKENGEKG
jgi:hypothetical protein